MAEVLLLGEFNNTSSTRKTTATWEDKFLIDMTEYDELQLDVYGYNFQGNGFVKVTPQFMVPKMSAHPYLGSSNDGQMIRLPKDTTLFAAVTGATGSNYYAGSLRITKADMIAPHMILTYDQTDLGNYGVDLYVYGYPIVTKK